MRALGAVPLTDIFAEPMGNPEGAREVEDPARHEELDRRHQDVARERAVAR